MENLKLKNINNFILTVDGASSSGKSTGANYFQKNLKFLIISSGLLYRWELKN